MSDPKQSADPAGEEPNEPGNGGVTVIDGIATGRIFTMRGLRTELDPLVEDALANLASDEGEVDAIRAEIRKRGLADEVARLTKSLNRAPLGDAERKLLATRGTYETLVVNALDMAIRNRRPEPGGVVNADHGTQCTSWVFGKKIRSARPPAVFRQRRRRIGQRHDGKLLVLDADRAPQPPTIEDPGRTRERDLRVHRDLPQPPTTPLCARLPHPDRGESRHGGDHHADGRMTF